MARNKKVKKNANGFGSVFYNKRRAHLDTPYTAFSPAYRTVRANGKVKYIRETIGNYATREEGIAALVQYSKSSEEKLADIRDTITFADVYDKVSKEWYVGLSSSTVKGYIGAYAKLSSLYNMKMVDIKTDALQNAINPYLNNRGLKNKIKIVMNKVFDYALRYDYILKDYSQFINLGKCDVPIIKRKIYTDDEIQTLWDNIDNLYSKIALILIYSGMRIGEIRVMQKENVYLDENYMIGGIKTAAGKNRIIPINDKIKPIVESLYSEATGNTLLNIKLTENAFNTYLRRELLKIGINHRSHDCRHTFASKMRSAGVPIDITQTIMGHKCNSLLLDTYTHYDKAVLIDAVNKI